MLNVISSCKGILTNSRPWCDTHRESDLEQTANSQTSTNLQGFHISVRSRSQARALFYRNARHLEALFAKLAGAQTPSSDFVTSMLCHGAWNGPSSHQDPLTESMRAELVRNQDDDERQDKRQCFASCWRYGICKKLRPLIKHCSGWLQLAVSELFCSRWQNKASLQFTRVHSSTDQLRILRDSSCQFTRLLGQRETARAQHDFVCTAAIALDKRCRFATASCKALLPCARFLPAKNVWPGWMHPATCRCVCLTLVTGELVPTQ